jgi:hypothetical protein
VGFDKLSPNGGEKDRLHNSKLSPR